MSVRSGPAAGADRPRLRAVGHAAAAVDVEQREVDEQRAGRLLDRLLDLLGGHRVGDDEREVEVARREAAGRLPLRDLRLAGEQDRRGRARATATRSVDAERVEHVGVDLADGADDVAAERQRRRPRRVQPGGRPGLVDARAEAHRAPRPRATPPSPPWRRGRPAPRASSSYSSGQLGAVARRIDVADLEQADAGATVRLVERDRLEQPRAASTVRSTLSSATSGLVMRIAWPATPARNEIVVGQERVGHRLVETRAEQHLAQPAAARWTGASRPCIGRLRHGLAEVRRSRSGGRPLRRRRSRSVLSGRHEGSATVSGRRRGPTS